MNKKLGLIVLGIVVFSTPAYAATTPKTQHNTTSATRFVPGAFSPAVPNPVGNLMPGAVATIGGTNATLTASQNEKWIVELSSPGVQQGGNHPRGWGIGSLILEPPDIIGPILSSSISQPTPLTNTPIVVASATGKGSWNFNWGKNFLQIHVPWILFSRNQHRSATFSYRLAWTVIQTPAKTVKKSLLSQTNTETTGSSQAGLS